VPGRACRVWRALLVWGQKKLPISMQIPGRECRTSKTHVALPARRAVCQRWPAGASGSRDWQIGILVVTKELALRRRAVVVRVWRVRESVRDSARFHLHSAKSGHQATDSQATQGYLGASPSREAPDSA
jgi:hypothetical protein